MFTRVKPLGWALYEELLSSEINALDINLSKAIDGVDGGSYTLSASLAITAPRFTFTAVDTGGLTGQFNVLAGDSFSLRSDGGAEVYSALGMIVQSALRLTLSAQGLGLVVGDGSTPKVQFLGPLVEIGETSGTTITALVVDCVSVVIGAPNIDITGGSTIDIVAPTVTLGPNVKLGASNTATAEVIGKLYADRPGFAESIELRAGGVAGNRLSVLPELYVNSAAIIIGPASTLYLEETPGFQAKIRFGSQTANPIVPKTKTIRRAFAAEHMQAEAGSTTWRLKNGVGGYSKLWRASASEGTNFDNPAGFGPTLTIGVPEYLSCGTVRTRLVGVGFTCDNSNFTNAPSTWVVTVNKYALSGNWAPVYVTKSVLTAMGIATAGGMNSLVTAFVPLTSGEADSVQLQNGDPNALTVSIWCPNMAGAEASATLELYSVFFDYEIDAAGW